MSTHVDLSSDRFNDLCINQVLKRAIDFIRRRVFRSFARIQIVNDMPGKVFANKRTFFCNLLSCWRKSIKLLENERFDNLGSNNTFKQFWKLDRIGS